jgi:AraC-like DNA-binding protein
MTHSPISIKVIPAPEKLKADVECFRIFNYRVPKSLSIKVSPIAVPGIVFQSKKGRSAIKNLTVRAEVNSSLPVSFIYGPSMKPSVMNYKPGPWGTVLVILKPHALKSLFGIDASRLANSFMELDQFTGTDLNSKLINARADQKRVELLTDLLIFYKNQAKTRDVLVEESLSLIHEKIESISMAVLLKRFSISERQFEKRFLVAVGITPHSYIRVRRFNEALSLMKTRKYERLTDVAHALNFYDQSHFIHDLKEFTGITPASIFQKVENFHDQGGFSYV